MTLCKPDNINLHIDRCTGFPYAGRIKTYTTSCIAKNDLSITKFYVKETFVLENLFWRGLLSINFIHSYCSHQ